MTATASFTSLSPPAAERGRPPGWLLLATGALALGCLAMAVAETNLWLHYLIDGGEYVSLVGLAFIAVAGLYLYRRQRLSASLPLVFPWLLFPVLTQGDQIIDNLSINWMRLISHVLLGALFAMPVAVIVLAARHALEPRPALRHRRWLGLVPGLRYLAEGRVREGTSLLAASLLALEIWIAVQFLGTLMVITLILMILGVLAYGSAASSGAPRAPVESRRGERVALGLLLVGLVAAVGLYLGFKHRPGAYQGSPSYFMDPSQRGAGFRLDRVAVPAGVPSAPAAPDTVRAALTGYGRALDRLLAGYYLLDRNYTYDYHNHLFMRSTPVLTNYRAAALERIADAHRLRGAADARAAEARATMADEDPLAALLDDVRAYAAFNFERAPVLERMSAGFELTRAGLQHAAHLYEGEGKVISVGLSKLLQKHQAVLASPAVVPVTSEFAAISRSVIDTYADRIVGF